MLRTQGSFVYCYRYVVAVGVHELLKPAEMLYYNKSYFIFVCVFWVCWIDAVWIISDIDLLNIILYRYLKMYNKDVASIEEFPVQESKRWSTDVCCTILTAIFALTLFVIACIFFSSGAIKSTFFSSSSYGKQCSTPYLFVANVNDPTTSSCVQVCPIGFYGQEGLCWPSNQALASKYWQDSQLSAPSNYSLFKNALFWTALLAVGAGLVWMVLVHFLPQLIPKLVLSLAIISLIVVAVLVLLKGQALIAQIGIKITILVVIALLIVIFIVILVMYKKALMIQGIFLDYSRKFIEANTHVFLYIPLFIILTIGLVALFLFQHAAFSSKHPSSNNFFNFISSGLLCWLNLIEFVWGLQFLRDTFNYCISGVVVSWYWGRNSNWYSPFKRLVTKNWGSIAAGSFLNAFFEIPTLIVELLTCHRNTCCNRAGQFCQKSCFCFQYIFNLVRTDVYTYINLSGIPYCNSARECAKICHQDKQFIGNYNPLKHYRLAAHVFLVAVLTLAGYVFTSVRVSSVDFWQLFCIIVVAYSIICWFVNIHADVAESLSTNFFVERYEERDYQRMQKALPVSIRIFQSFRKEIEHLESKKGQDGTC